MDKANRIVNILVQRVASLERDQAILLVDLEDAEARIKVLEAQLQGDNDGSNPDQHADQ